MLLDSNNPMEKGEDFMKGLNRFNLVIMAAIAFAIALGAPIYALAEETYEPLPAAGDKCPIGNDYYFKYSFDKKPQLGTVILKIELFNKDGQQETGLKIIGDSGMPSMKGHHDSGDVAFQLNKKGDYLLPVNVVMPGDWEVRLKFIKGDQVIYRGSIRFDI
jgi:hypothetical protein